MKHPCMDHSTIQYSHLYYCKLAEKVQYIELHNSNYWCLYLLLIFNVISLIIWLVFLPFSKILLLHSQSNITSFFLHKSQFCAKNKVAKIMYLAAVKRWFLFQQDFLNSKINYLKHFPGNLTAHRNNFKKNFRNEK